VPASKRGARCGVPKPVSASCRPRGPVFHRRAREERHEAVPQHIQELMQRGRAQPPALRDNLGVRARQHAGRAGQSHQPDRQFRPFAARIDVQDVGRRIDQAGGRTEPDHFGRIVRPPRPGQHPHRGIETKPSRRRRQFGQHGTGFHARCPGAGGAAGEVRARRVGRRFVVTPVTI